MLLKPEAALAWYAVRVKSKFEQTVSAILQQKGVEQFLPTYRSRRIWSDRIRTMDLPLFPGYVFCRIPLDARDRVLTTSGVMDLVGAGRRPIPISDQEIAAIQTIIQSHLAAEPWPFLRIGQQVRIRRGPLAGLEGILVKVKNSYRLVVSVTLLERSVAAEIDAAYVAPVV
jgi:transcription antitermination factor NusG